VLKQIDEADDAAAVARVLALRAEHPGWTPDQLAEHLVKRKCQQAAAVGTATAGSGLIPGIGTLAALTVGTVADVGAILKLQTELVMEIAAVHGRALSTEEKRRVVVLVTGWSVGKNQLLSSSGARLSLKLTEQYAQRWLARTLPFVGVAASAGVDMLSTYLVGRRAHAYFGLGPQAVGSWQESVRALSGLDERTLISWIGEQTGRSARIAQRAGRQLQGAAGAARSAAGAAASGAAGRAKGTLSTAARSTRRLSAGPARAARLLPRPRRQEITESGENEERTEE
jgi:hypothetical protein